MMIFINLATKKGRVTSETARTFVKVLAPFSPHMAEELWNMLGNTQSLAYEPWPLFNEDYLKEDSFDYPVSFNGKMRFNITLPVTMTKEEIINIVMADDRTTKWLAGSKPSNIIVVLNRIVNIVVKN